MEVGPLGAHVGGLCQRTRRVQRRRRRGARPLEVPATALFSTLGRTAARGLETRFGRSLAAGGIRALDGQPQVRRQRHANTTSWEPANLARRGQRLRFTEAPRGSLGHWVHIKDRKIANYQIVVPSTWNASPKDAKGQHGAYEAAC